MSAGSLMGSKDGLNFVSRKRESERIMKENQAFARRLYEKYNTILNA